MSWNTIIEGVIAGTATAVTWLVLIFACNWCRNILFEYRLRSALGKCGFAFYDNAFGLTFTNTTSATIRVWGVAFSYRGGGYAPLHYTGTKTAHRRRRLGGLLLPRYQLLDFPSFESEPEQGAVTLGFDMSATWTIDQERALRTSPPDGAYCLIEFTTLIWTTKRIVVELARPTELQECYGRFMKRREKDAAEEKT